MLAGTTELRATATSFAVQRLSPDDEDIAIQQVRFFRILDINVLGDAKASVNSATPTIDNSCRFHG